MALYAIDRDDVLFAGDAEKGKTYRCLDCLGPVKQRQGKNRFPHFYHIRSTARCRLHSKTEDHLRAQLQLKNHFASSALQIERPFSQIDRIADVCWEDEKIIFEVQCSAIAFKEVELRVKDYESLGYSVVWLLDDKRYNKQILRPAESHLRTLSCYYLSIRRELNLEIYDQFEIFAHNRRVKKGKRMPIDLTQPVRPSNLNWPEEWVPSQILSLPRTHYFLGDRIHRALLAKNQSHAIVSLLHWRALEMRVSKQEAQSNKIRTFFSDYFLKPYRMLLQSLIRLIHK